MPTFKSHVAACPSHFISSHSFRTVGLQSARELYRLSDRRLSAKSVSTFANRGVSRGQPAIPYGSNLDFVDRSRYFYLQVAPQLF
jgi:hypothetical protein